MRVKDIMTKGVASVSPRASVAEALDVMIRSRLSGLAVVDDAGALVGVVSEADFLRRSELGTGTHWLGALFSPGRAAEVYARAHARRVDEIMSTDVATIDETARLDEAVAMMEKRRVKRLPVLREGKVVGMLTRADFVRVLAQLLRQPYEQTVLPDDEIKRRIRAEMRAHFWAPTASVDVDVKEGVVSLHGVLTDERERNAMHALVENVEGVRLVHDHMVWVEPISGMVMTSPGEAAKSA
ncbi:MAG: CBS domain-containing protein [Hyphomicrobiales bacterium]|nr:CBS domain-containing protein [Hyphomicrobiales bacterium]MBV8662107.1 CBS domain-containing protein [Hyphomicrobiales bacterium]